MQRIKELLDKNKKLNQDLQSQYNNINLDSNNEIAENSRIADSKDTDRFVSIENKGVFGMVDYRGVTKDLLS